MKMRNQSQTTGLLNAHAQDCICYTNNSQTQPTPYDICFQEETLNPCKLTSSSSPMFLSKLFQCIWSIRSILLQTLQLAINTTNLGDQPSLQLLLKIKMKINSWHLYKKDVYYFWERILVVAACICRCRPADWYSNRSAIPLTKSYLHCNNIQVFSIYTFIILKRGLCFK